MEDIIRLKDQYYVLATSSLADQRTRVLKQGECFAVFDVYGNIQPIGSSAQGFFSGATRYLSALELRVGGLRPLLLSSNVKNDNTLLTVDMMNRGTGEGPDTVSLLPSTLHVFRAKFLREEVCYERLRITNYGAKEAQLRLSVRFSADFADIFELRGVKRTERGELLPPELKDGKVRLSYRGLDGITRSTRLTFEPAPNELTGDWAHFSLTLSPGAQATYFLTVACGRQGELPPVLGYSDAFATVGREVKAGKARDCEIETSNTEFNEWLARCQADLHMMITRTPDGPYPYAGVPLFNTVFGRDGLITALQSLWVNPEIARGVLGYLARTQATERVDAQDAEPGKILHEVREGEMVATGEVPFQRYYGSVDSTPLFLVLASAYYKSTGDREFLDALWPHLERALTWIDESGDLDGDGFVEYQRRSPKGLINQGWKDSFDSVFYEDGTLAEGPIALCEIQGYVYDAKLRMAELYEVRGEKARAEKLRSEAEALQRKFEDAFWCDDLGTYALALDGKKRPCRVRSSNAGHCLYSGIASPERAAKVAELLLSERMFSGWGIRTVGREEARYNPMSYHDGSVWPHDNSLIAKGLARYGHKRAVIQLLGGLFDAARFMDLQRMPELFCGFVRRPGEGPTLYPVACAPQAWASATIFTLLQSALGMSVRGNPARVTFRHPRLPESLTRVCVRRLRVGPSATLDVQFERHHDDDVGINILRRTGSVEVSIVK